MMGRPRPIGWLALRDNFVVVFDHAYSHLRRHYHLRLGTPLTGMGGELTAPIQGTLNPATGKTRTVWVGVDGWWGFSIVIDS